MSSTGHGEAPVGDVLGMDEDDLVDLLAGGDEDGAGQAVEIAAGHESHGRDPTPKRETPGTLRGAPGAV